LNRNIQRGSTGVVVPKAVLHGVRELGSLVVKFSLLGSVGRDASGVPTSFEFREVVSSIVNCYAGQLKRSHISASVNGETVRMDNTSLELIEFLVTPLLDNAIKFSPSGSEVEVRWEDRTEHLVLEIRDHESGIPRPYREPILLLFGKTASVDASTTRASDLACIWTR
jgi:two-component system OmpR family sensor kinase